ncbi:hypothetical protein [uncultured Tenacibaculum sp.]|uniref:hypothetical protein n=1 Tax=uncultured Tenacibaculum sp. TaxID=174713 RepID=UPI0026191964|nr:hypothetical protein [uncultured Tenacibaculum sp.]
MKKTILGVMLLMLYANIKAQNNLVNTRFKVKENTSSIEFGQWDGSRNRIESVGRKLFLTSYTGGISFGNNGAEQIVMNNLGYLGIGTSNPEYIMDIVSGVDDYKQLRVKSPGSPLIKLSGSYNSGNGAEFWQNGKGDVILNINSVTNGFYIQSDGKIGMGTISPDSKLAVNGNIHTKEVKVDLIGWSDFVFEKEYSLPTLDEVETYIKEKGHLKDIPSEKEVLKNGIYLGEMDAKLLQKIEELTLYAIQQEKKIKEQEKELKKLKGLSDRLEKLEKLLEPKN